MMGFLCDHQWVFMLFFYIFAVYWQSNVMVNEDVNMNIGAILDYNSIVGKEEKIGMEMAVADFHAGFHHDGIALHTLDSGRDPVRAAASARELISKHQVKAIIGLNRWEETLFVVRISNESQVPLLSLANDIPVWAPKKWPFLVNVACNQNTQTKAIAAIVQSWKLQKVTFIYEETSNTIIPSLITSLQEVNSKIDKFVPLSPFAPYTDQLLDLKTRKCHVFIVDASLEIATNLFTEATNMGMMKEGYIWITTDAITSRVDSFNQSLISVMQGVLGVKSYYPHTHIKHEKFTSRFKTLFDLKYPNDSYTEPGTNALQAYDAIWAVGSIMNSTNQNDGRNFLDYLHSLRGSELGPPVSVFQIINFVGKSYREMGYWSDGLGFSSSIGEGCDYSHKMKILGQVYFPGGPWDIPKGSGYDLNLLVPPYTTFSDYLYWEKNTSGGSDIAKGFAIDVFERVAAFLRKNKDYNFHYKLIKFDGSKYDEIVKNIDGKMINGAIGDIAILAKRSNGTAFSQPYTQAGIQLVAYKHPAGRQWLFKRPFTLGMWVATFIVNLYNGFVVWLIERKNNPDFIRNNRVGTTIWIGFTTLFNALQGDKLHTTVAKMVMIVWLFVAIITTQTYTASLTSFLTLQNINSKVIDLQTIISTNRTVGCDENSFVPKYLENVLGIDPKNIRTYTSGDDYPDALRKKKIDAAFLEIPYVNILLGKNCDNITTGEMFKVGGFGFVFEKGADYIPDISEAILNMSESGKLRHLENSMLDKYKCRPSDYVEHDSVGLNSFSVLFIITTLVSTFALIFTMYKEQEQVLEQMLEQEQELSRMQNLQLQAAS